MSRCQQSSEKERPRCERRDAVTPVYDEETAGGFGKRFGVLAIVLAFIALGWATAGFTDFTCRAVSEYFSTPHAFGDFFLVQDCASSASHFRPDKSPTWDAPYAALCYQLITPFPASHIGAVVFSLGSALLYLVGVALFVRARGLPFVSSLAMVAFSGVFIRTIERGNPILLAAAAVCVFLAYYDAQVAWKRYLAAFFLAVAAVLKVGPALLGMLYVPQLFRPKTWQVREIAFFLVSAALLLLVPFFLFDYNGLSDIRQWVANARENGSHYGLMGNFGLPACFQWLNTACATWGHPLSFMGMVASRPFSAAFGLIVFVGALFCRDRVVRLYLVISAMVLIPGNSFAYCLLYFLPAVLWILQTKKLGEGILLVLLLFPATTLSVAGVSLAIPFINVAVMGYGAYCCVRTALPRV